MRIIRYARALPRFDRRRPPAEGFGAVRRWVGLTAVSLAAIASGGCGREATPVATRTVTVTVTPSDLRGAPADDPGGSIAGRLHDVGTIVGTRGQGDDRILLLDRWSVDGVTDQVVARDGVPIVPEHGDRFSNVNPSKVYEVPLSDVLRVVLNRCVPTKDPRVLPGIHSRAVSLAEFLRLPDRTDTVTILSYAGGRLVTLETSPRCPRRAAAPTASGSPAPGGTP